MLFSRKSGLFCNASESAIAQKMWMEIVKNIVHYVGIKLVKKKGKKMKNNNNEEKEKIRAVINVLLNNYEEGEIPADYALEFIIHLLKWGGVL